MSLDKFFHLKENNTTVSTEIIAGITTFFTIVYILTINPMILGESGAGMPTGAVYLATIVTTVIGCLIFGLFANIPLVPSAALGLSYFFTYTIVQFLGFTWKEAISMVFICGIINLIITICDIKGNLIKCIPQQLKIAMGAGIGLFVLYTGLINSKLINLTDTKISLNWIEIGTNPAIWVFFIGLILTIILIILKIRGTFIISIIATTLIGLIPLFGITNLNSSISLMEAFEQLPTTFCAIFTPDGIPSLFSETGRIPLVTQNL